MGGNVIVVRDQGEWDRCHGQSKSKNMLLVVDFTATWCGPCRIIGPVFEQLSSQYTNAIFAEVDVDENGDISQESGVKGIPAFHFFKGGSKVDEMVGADANRLELLVKKHYTAGSFQGQGYTLSGPSSSQQNPVAPSSVTPKLPHMDETLPTTSIQFRMPDGSRFVGRFNTTATIADLRSFVAASAPLPASFQLLSSFPPRPLEPAGDSVTIEAAGLLNSALSVKF
ncbi:hypothetical protein CLOM_g1967 [Closterium sp. NIES-68]|nr:hypothetical protein CLOM_g1967 [Closterium sp. NIES-68]